MTNGWFTSSRQVKGETGDVGDVGDSSFSLDGSLVIIGIHTCVLFLSELHGETFSNFSTWDFTSSFSCCSLRALQKPKWIEPQWLGLESSSAGRCIVHLLRMLCIARARFWSTKTFPKRSSRDLTIWGVILRRLMSAPVSECCFLQNTVFDLDSKHILLFGLIISMTIRKRLFTAPEPSRAVTSSNRM